jgi:hypothetical protein
MQRWDLWNEKRWFVTNHNAQQFHLLMLFNSTLDLCGQGSKRTMSDKTLFQQYLFLLFFGPELVMPYNTSE